MTSRGGSGYVTVQQFHERNLAAKAPSAAPKEQPKSVAKSSLGPHEGANPRHEVQISGDTVTAGTMSRSLPNKSSGNVSREGHPHFKQAAKPNKQLADTKTAEFLSFPSHAPSIPLAAATTSTNSQPRLETQFTASSSTVRDGASPSRVSRTDSSAQPRHDQPTTSEVPDRANSVPLTQEQPLENQRECADEIADRVERSLSHQESPTKSSPPYPVRPVPQSLPQKNSAPLLFEKTDFLPRSFPPSAIKPAASTGGASRHHAAPTQGPISDLRRTPSPDLGGWTSMVQNMNAYATRDKELHEQTPSSTPTGPIPFVHANHAWVDASKLESLADSKPATSAAAGKRGAFKWESSEWDQRFAAALAAAKAATHPPSISASDSLDHLHQEIPSPDSREAPPIKNEAIPSPAETTTRPKPQSETIQKNDEVKCPPSPPPSYWERDLLLSDYGTPTESDEGERCSDGENVEAVRENERQEMRKSSDHPVHTHPLSPGPLSFDVQSRPPKSAFIFSPPPSQHPNPPSFTSTEFVSSSSSVFIFSESMSSKPSDPLPKSFGPFSSHQPASSPFATPSPAPSPARRRFKVLQREGSRTLASCSKFDNPTNADTTDPFNPFQSEKENKVERQQEDGRRVEDDAPRVYTAPVLDIADLGTQWPVSGVATLHSSFVPPPMVRISRDNEIEADQMALRGNQFFKSGQYHEAVSMYREAIKLNPNSALHYGNRAAALIMLNRWEEALPDCEKAFALDQSHVKSLIRTGRCLLYLGDLDSARKILTLASGRLTGRQHVHDSEVQALCKSVSLAMEDRTQAKIHLASRNYARSLVCIDSALKISAGSNELMCAKAAALLGCEKISECDKQCSSVLASDPLNADVLLTSGRSLYLQGNLDGCIARYAQALRGDPDNLLCKIAIKKIRAMLQKKTEGNNFFQSGNIDGAIQVYSELIAETSDNDKFLATIFTNRAAAFLKKSQFQLAIKDCSTALNLWPTYARALQRRSKCEMELGEWDDAVCSLQRLVDTCVLTTAEMSEASAQLKFAKAKQQETVRAKDHYAMLGVSESASIDDIRKSYKKLALRWHPDKQTDGDEARQKAERKFKEIAEAYRVLSDASAKQKYDLSRPDTASTKTHGQHYQQPQYQHRPSSVPASFMKTAPKGNDKKWSSEDYARWCRDWSAKWNK